MLSYFKVNRSERDLEEAITGAGEDDMIARGHGVERIESALTLRVRLFKRPQSRARYDVPTKKRARNGAGEERVAG